jgi:hypothetical protein
LALRGGSKAFVAVGRRSREAEGDDARLEGRRGGRSRPMSLGLGRLVCLGTFELTMLMLYLIPLQRRDRSYFLSRPPQGPSAFPYALHTSRPLAFPSSLELTSMRSTYSRRVDAQARKSRCPDGSHGSHARRVRRRVHRSFPPFPLPVDPPLLVSLYETESMVHVCTGPRRRCLCDASVGNERHRRVRRPRLPNKDARHAQADWTVSSPSPHPHELLEEGVC